MFIAPGFSFTDNVKDQGTVAAFGQFVASAVATSFALSEFNTLGHLVQVAAAVPGSDQGEGSLWFDTLLNVLRQKDNGQWNVQYQGPQMTNSSGSTIPRGAWLVPSADNVVSQCATQLRGDVLGVYAITCPTATGGLVIRTGISPARCKGPLSYGDVLVSCSQGNAFGDVGYARGATMSFGNTNFTAGLEIGMALGTIAGNTTGLVTCMIWR